MSFVLPFVVAMVAVVVASIAQRRLRPDVATTTLAVATASAAAAWVWALLALSLGALGEAEMIGGWLAWCRNLHFADGHVPWWVGLAAGVLLVASTASFAQRLRRSVRDRRQLPDCGRHGRLVLDSDEPAAFAVPGRRGGIVVSRGLIDALDQREKAVVWAHEHAHLRNRHHWYLTAADLAAAALPVLRPVARQVHFGTERWADEDSVRATGDRHLVARAIAKAAIATSGHHRPQMAMAASAVPARVEALIAPRHELVGRAASIAVALPLMALTVGGSSVQLHHLVAFIEHVCGGA